MKSLKNFPPISDKQWKQQIQFELEGLDYNNTLLSKYNGIHIKPFYTIEDYQIDIKPINTNKNLKNIADIITKFAKNGAWKQSKKEDFKTLKQKINNESAIEIDTSLYENAGANIIQQLAYSLAIADEYTEYHTKFNFTFNIASNYFLEISKINAFSHLWSLFVKHNSLKDFLANTKLISSHRNKTNTELDEIKYTTEYMCIHSSKNAIRGTFYINSIAKQIIEESFNLYLLIKNNGGFLKQLKLGNIQRKIKNSAAKDKYQPSIVKNVRKTIIQTIPKVKFKDKYVNDFSYPINKISINKIKITDQAAGFPPFLRGINTTMYTQTVWKNIKLSNYPSEVKVIHDDTNDITKTLALGIDYIQSEYKKNKTIESITKYLIFDIKIEGEQFENIAKIRALRVLWSNIIEKYKPINKDSLAMHIHCEISGRNFTEKTYRSLSAILGGVQSIDTEPIINNFLIKESYITKVIDPWGGSYLIEELTKNLISEIWKEICYII